MLTKSSISFQVAMARMIVREAATCCSSTTSGITLLMLSVMLMAG